MSKHYAPWAEDPDPAVVKDPQKLKAALQKSAHIIDSQGEKPGVTRVTRSRQQSDVSMAEALAKRHGITVERAQELLDLY